MRVPARLRRNPQGIYTAAAHRAAATVIRTYSTSFSLASSLLPHRTAQGISSLYAMVRVADEIVDGAHPAAGPPGAYERQRALDDFQQRIADAYTTGFSTDLIAHAFGDTARRTGIDASLWEPFFASMRSDINPQEHSEDSLEKYIYGSAEVIGLMCLAVFLEDVSVPAQQRRTLESGARCLGAAFQRINFLRDLGADTVSLGRSYLTGPHGQLTEDVKEAQLDRASAEFTVARQALPLLPVRVRAAVCTALDIFAELGDQIRTTPAQVLAHKRLRVAASRKTAIAARAAATTAATAALPRSLRR